MTSQISIYAERKVEKEFFVFNIRFIHHHENTFSLFGSLKALLWGRNFLNSIPNQFRQTKFLFRSFSFSASFSSHRCFSFFMRILVLGFSLSHPLLLLLFQAFGVFPKYYDSGKKFPPCFRETSWRTSGGLARLDFWGEQFINDGNASCRS